MSVFKSLVRVGCLVLVLAIASDRAVAQKSTSLTVSPGDWSTAANWSNGAPDANDTITVDGNVGSPGTANQPNGYGISGTLSIVNGGVVNMGDYFIWESPNCVVLDATSRFNVTGGLYFRNSGVTNNVAFANAATNGKVSVGSNQSLNIGDSGESATLSIGTGSTGAEFGSLGMGANGTLNVNGATIGFTADSSFGGAGTAGVVNLASGAVVNFGGYMLAMTPNAVSIDPSSRVNVAGALYFRQDGVTNNLVFTNTAANGKMSVASNQTLHVGDSGENATLSIGGGSTGTQFGSLNMAHNATLNVSGATIDFTADSSFGGAGGTAGVVNLTSGAVVNFGGYMLTTTPNSVSVDSSSRVNVAGPLYFRQDGVTNNLVFTNTAANGKMSVASNQTLHIGDSGETATLSIGAGSTGTQFGSLSMAQNATLNVAGATINFETDATFGGGGGTAGVINVSAGGVVNVGQDLYANTSTANGIVMSTASQFNVIRDFYVRAATLNIVGGATTVGGNVDFNGGDFQLAVVQNATQTNGMTLNGNLVMAAGDLLQLTFDANGAVVSGPLSGSPSTFDWALRWTGNKVTNLQSLYSAGRLAVTAPSGATFSPTNNIYYDSGSDYTYVGFVAVPEPSITVLAAAGLVASLLAGRRLGRRG